MQRFPFLRQFTANELSVSGEALAARRTRETRNPLAPNGTYFRNLIANAPNGTGRIGRCKVGLRSCEGTLVPRGSMSHGRTVVSRTITEKRWSTKKAILLMDRGSSSINISRARHKRSFAGAKVDFGATARSE